jgi:hypothetical protein
MEPSLIKFFLDQRVPFFDFDGQAGMSLIFKMFFSASPDMTCMLEFSKLDFNAQPKKDEVGWPTTTTTRCR